MVIDKNLSELNEDSLVNIIKLDLVKFDIATQNYVKDNKSDFIEAIDTILDNVRNLRVPCNAGNTVSFDFNVFSIESATTDIKERLDTISGSGGCYINYFITPVCFYELDEYDDLQAELITDTEAQEVFLDKLSKSLVETLPVKEVNILSDYANFVRIDFDFDTYVKQLTYQFSQLAILHLAEFGIKAKAAPISDGIRIAMEAEDLLEKLSKK